MLVLPLRDTLLALDCATVSRQEKVCFLNSGQSIGCVTKNGRVVLITALAMIGEGLRRKISSCEWKDDCVRP